MNKKVILLASLCLLVMVVAVSAQDKMADFSGEWKLEVEKSELGERSQIESMTMTVTQSETELSIDRKITNKGNDESIGGALGGGNRGRGRQRMRAGLPTIKYDLSGKETVVELADGIMTGETKYKAKFDDGKLMLTQNRTLNTPRGKRDNKLVETWEMSKDGNTLTVSSVTETPRGNRSSKMVFMPNGERPPNPSEIATFDTTSNRKIPKRISGGVINGKATRLPKPEYPSEAQEANVKGSVQVEVIINKKGKVISAKAISGHPLLRQSSVDAAKKARFKKTFLRGQVVEVVGIIVYLYK